MKGRDGVQAPVTWGDAFKATNDRLNEISRAAGPSSVLGFGSALATNEGLFLFREFLRRSFPGSRLEFRLAAEDARAVESEDDVLRRRDKHPNSIGAVRLGFADGELGGIDGAIDAARAGRIKAGIVAYLKPLVARPEHESAEEKIAELISALEYSVVLVADKRDWQTAANVVLPVVAWSEEEGTYTNFEGRLQYAGRAVRSRGEALPMWQIFAALSAVNEQDGRWTSVEEVFSIMTSVIRDFGSATWGGTRLPRPAATAV
jgi:predicted molibdopterin-dependent oxidoreductase YjgC